MTPAIGVIDRNHLERVLANHTRARMPNDARTLTTNVGAPVPGPAIADGGERGRDCWVPDTCVVAV
jgi:hypothetical protein